MYFLECLISSVLLRMLVSSVLFRMLDIECTLPGKEEFITGWCSKYKLKYLGIPIMLGSGIYSDNGKKIR